MKAAAILLATFAIAMVDAHAQTRPQRPRAIFNGENLDGWQGDPALWSVVDGVITGTSAADDDQKLEQNSFLIYRAADVEDFELTLKVRVTGDNNSGVQYRSRIVDEAEHIVAGYQLDIHPKQDLVGMIYEERGRGLLARRGRSARARAEKVENVGSLDASEKVDIAQWNEYAIIARGNLLTHKINGKIASTLRDDNLAKRSLKGVIALQLHAGAPMKVEAKDIILRRLLRSTVAPPKETIPVTPTKLPKPRWIEATTKDAAGMSGYFRHAWRPKSPVKKSTLHIAASGEFQIFLNGKEIGNGSGGRKPHRFEIANDLTEFTNLLAIRIAPGDGTPSLAAQIDFSHVDDSISRNATDQNWLSRTAKEDPPDWTGRLTERRSWRESKATGAVDGTMFVVPTTEPNIQPDLERQTTSPGFYLKKLYDVPIETEGSWVALTSGPKGTLFASAENGGLFQIDLAAQETGVTVQSISLDIDHANGLLWAFEHLFVSVNHPAKSGLYRIGDSDDDGKLDSISTLRRFSGSGENGPHGIALGPSPQSIYLVCGNQTTLPEAFGRRRVPKLWQDDQLLSPTPDGEPSPGGWIAMTRAAGIEWELHSVGLRNPYDLAFNRHGDLFTCDGSSPADRGTPFFRPASVYHVPNGVDFGVRGVGKNFPPQYQDTIPAVTQLPPGTPSGITFGYGAKFPPKFQEALFVGDRSNSTITAVHLQATGSSYTAESEEFIIAPGHPVIDITIGSDGAMYFISGDREKPSALWRVTYTGDDPTTPTTLQPFTPNTERRHALLDKIGLLQGIRDKRAVGSAWQHLADPDRIIRNAARTAIEHHPTELSLARMAEESDPRAIIEAATAIARTGLAEHQPSVIEKLDSIDFSQLANEQKINYLRAIGLTFIRLSPPTADQKDQLVKK